jgi:hypothetical protein
MSRIGDTRSGWVAVEGRMVRESPSGKAVLFEFALSVYNGRNPHWIPKKCFKIEEGRFWIAYWFHQKLVEEWETGETPKRTTKKELVAKFSRRIEADESFTKPEPKKEPEPKFFGNVNTVLEKILN